MKPNKFKIGSLLHFSYTTGYSIVDNLYLIVSFKQTGIAGGKYICYRMDSDVQIGFYQFDLERDIESGKLKIYD
jgi:hypothetical protein